MRKLVSLLLTAMVLISTLVIAVNLSSSTKSTNLQSITTATKLFQAGNYVQAIGIYEQLIDQGLSDSAVYFNLGNAYYQQGDMGRAMLNYRRANQLDPRDEDIKRNLKIVESSTTTSEDILTTAPGPIQSMAHITQSWLSINETAIFTLTLWFLFFFLIILYRMLKRGRIRTSIGYLTLLVIFIFVFIGVSFGSRIIVEKTQPDAIVIVSEITLNSEPKFESATEFNLKNGTKIRLLDKQGEWVKLSTAGNTIQGWVPASSVEIVNVDAVGT
jgi:tetratricopeptide (TPR) repeat protein